MRLNEHTNLSCSQYTTLILYRHLLVSDNTFNIHIYNIIYTYTARNPPLHNGIKYGVNVMYQLMCFSQM